MKRLLLLLTLVALWSYLRADVRPARVFADHMVLQRGQPVPVWGWAKPGEKITLTFNGQTLRTQAAKDSTWRIDLVPMQAGGPFTMTLAGKKNTVTLQDILIGEVWICSGQSNMEWPLSQTRDAEAEIAAANYPQIRQLYVRHEIAMSPRKDLPNGAWTACSPQTAGEFTAVGYFFARKLQQELGVPIGLINTNWGGTEVETWI
ncbi:MAG: sialate O-acetylesterase, partial [Bacteroidetes bacterium]